MADWWDDPAAYQSQKAPAPATADTSQSWWTDPSAYQPSSSGLMGPMAADMAAMRPLADNDDGYLSDVGHNLATFGRSALSGAMGLAAMAYDASPNAVAQRLAQKIAPPDLSGVPSDQRDAVALALAPASDQVRALAAQVAPKIDPNDVGDRVESFLGGSIPMLATGGLGGAEAAGAPLLGRIAAGARAMALPAAETARSTYVEGVDAGLSPLQAGARAAVAGAGTEAFGVLPPSLGGNIVARIIGGGALQGGAGELARMAENAVTPDSHHELQQPFDPLNFSLTSLLGGGMAAALGGHADPLAQGAAIADQIAKDAGLHEPVAPNKTALTPVELGLPVADQTAIDTAPNVAGFNAHDVVPVPPQPAAPKPSTPKVEPNLTGSYIVPVDDVATARAALKDAGLPQGFLRNNPDGTQSLAFSNSLRDKVAPILEAAPESVPPVEDTKPPIQAPQKPDAAAATVPEKPAPATNGMSDLDTVLAGLDPKQSADLNQTIAAMRKAGAGDQVDDFLAKEAARLNQGKLATNESTPAKQPDEPAVAARMGAGTDVENHGNEPAGNGQIERPVVAKSPVADERVPVPDGVSAGRDTTESAQHDRLKEAEDHYFGKLADEVGWEQVGGRLLRAPLNDGEGATGAVTGRTQWLGKQGPMGESALWRTRPDVSLKPEQAREALRKAAAGEPLRAIEQRFVDHARKTARMYAENEEAERLQSARDNGFDSIEAEQAHYAAQERNANEPDTTDQAIEDSFNGIGGDRGEDGYVPFSKRHGGADADMFGGSTPERAKTPPERYEQQGGLFAEPSVTERLRAAVEAKDAARNAGTRTDTGEGGLFDGERPNQVKFSKLADGERQAPDTSGIETHEPTPEEIEHVARLQELRKAVLDENERKQALTEPQDSFVRRIWRALASKEGIYQNQRVDANSVTDAMNKADVGATRVGIQRENDENGTYTAHYFKTNKGTPFVVKEYPHSYQVNVSDLKPGERGNAIYNAVSGLAKRTGKVFEGDTQGLSDTGVLRRTDNMMSAALKYGAETVAPHERQQAPGGAVGWAEKLPWKVGDNDFNTSALIKTQAENVARLLPEIKDWRYNFKSNRFEKSDGSPVTADDFDAMQKAAGDRIRERGIGMGAGDSRMDKRGQEGLAKATPYGESSIKRAVVTQSLAAATDSAGRSAALDWVRSKLPEHLERTLYSKTDKTPAAAGVSVSEARAHAEKAWGKRIIRRLEGNGILKFITKQEAFDSGIVKEAKSVNDFNDTQGFYDPKTGKAYIIADNVNPKRVGNIILHEIGTHFGAAKIVGKDTMTNILNRMQSLRGKDADIDRAFAAVPKDTPAKHVGEEAMGYLVEQSPKHTLVQRFTDAFKRGLNLLGIPMPKLESEVQAIRRIARENLRTASRLKGDAVLFGKDGEVMPSRRIPDDGERTEEPEPAHELPPRAPGESQDEWHARVMRQGRVPMIDGVRAPKQMRDIGRGEMRAMWANHQRQMDRAGAAFKDAFKVFDKAGKAANLEAIHQWETGKEVTSLPHRLFFHAMKDAYDKRIQRIRELAPGSMQDLIENYFPHLWEDPTKAAKWYQALQARGPLEGNKSFLKQRVHDTIKDGMESGLKPISTNPVDLVLAKMAQMDKFIAFNEFRKGLQERGWLKEMDAGERVPYGYARVEDPAFRKAGGLQGYYAVPELIAKDINNYLAPSLYRFAGFRAFRGVQNFVMQARLGWSLFHLGFTTFENFVTHANTGVQYALHGDPFRAVKSIFDAAISPVWSPIEGHHLNQQWLGLKGADANTAAVLDALAEGGAHFKMSRTEYNNALPKFLRALRQRDIRQSLKSSLGAIGEAGSWFVHHVLVPNQKMAARVNLAKFELDRVAGQFRKAGRTDIKAGDYANIIAAMEPDALKQIMGKVVARIDDRLGQMNYDNQFWNKTVRESFQVLIGAVGWQVGTVRTVTGAASDIRHLWAPEKLLSSLDKEGKITGVNAGSQTDRLTYLATLALVMGATSAITQYAMTGKGPQEIKDYFFPKTGRKNADGSDERLQYPSYWMDHYKLATHPFQTAEHKIHPSIGMIMEAVNNQDYFGTQIRNPDASWQKQAEQVAEYIVKGFLPYTVTNMSKASQNDVGIGRKLAAIVGVTNAPASVSRTDFQAFVAKGGARGWAQITRTPEQAEYKQRIRDAEDAIRLGKKPDLSGLAEKDIKNVTKSAKSEVPVLQFSRLSVEDKLRAYDLATDAERKRYGLKEIIHHSKPDKSVVFKRLPLEEQEQVRKRIHEITGN